MVEQPWGGETAKHVLDEEMWALLGLNLLKFQVNLEISFLRDSFQVLDDVN